MVEVTHVAYADKTDYNTGQFRGVAAISLALTVSLPDRYFHGS